MGIQWYSGDDAGEVSGEIVDVEGPVREQELDGFERDGAGDPGHGKDQKVHGAVFALFRAKGAAGEEHPGKVGDGVGKVVEPQEQHVVVVQYLRCPVNRQDRKQEENEKVEEEGGRGMGEVQSSKFKIQNSKSC